MRVDNSMIQCSEEKKFLKSNTESHLKQRGAETSLDQLFQTGSHAN